MENRLIESLKKKNLRITEARKAVYEVLVSSDRSLSVQGVYAQIQKVAGVNTDKVSVYRSLNLFSNLGLVHKFQDGKYSVCTHDSDKDKNHVHLHIMANCCQCGATVEIDSHNENLCKSVKQIKSSIESFGEFSGLTFQGVCNSCMKTSS